MAKNLEDLAAGKGWTGLLKLQGLEPGKGVGGGEPGEAGKPGGGVETEKMLMIGNNVTEIRDTIQFLKKAIDEKLNEPVVSDVLLGVGAP
jgi:hypothetical protein